VLDHVWIQVHPRTKIVVDTVANLSTALMPAHESFGDRVAQLEEQGETLPADVADHRNGDDHCVERAPPSVLYYPLNWGN